MSRDRLARETALDALGWEGRSVLSRLEAAGLKVVFSHDRGEDDKNNWVTISGVQLCVPDDWREPYALKVEYPNGSEVVLHVAPNAVKGVREAALLQQTLGCEVAIEVVDGEPLLVRAWRESATR